MIKTTLYKFKIVLGLILIIPLFVNCGGSGSTGGGSTGTKYTYSETASDHKTTEYNNQYGLGKIKAAEGYAALGGYTKGGPIKVAVLDTGIDSDHSQLDGQIASGGYDFANSDDNAEDDHGHGTHVAGIIAAEKTGTGMHGVCPNCDIMPMKVCNSAGSCSEANVASGLDRAREQGAKVANLSLRFTSATSTLKTALTKAVNAGMIITVASGNDYYANWIGWPARYAQDYSEKTVFAVGATNSSNAITSYSNECGGVSNWCDYFIHAPGDAIYSTTYDGSYGNKSGTSMAAPHVAGAAGLLFEEFPNLSASQIAALIWDNASDMGYASSRQGKGLLNLQGALSAISTQYIPVTKNLLGKKYNINSSNISLSNAFKNDFSHNDLFSDAIIIDGLNRAYRNDLTQGINVNISHLPSISFSNFDQEKKTESFQNTILNFQSNSTFEYTSDDRYDNSRIDYSDINLLNTELNYTLNDNSKINIIYNKSANARLGFDQIDTFANNLTLDPSVNLSNPYLNYIKKPTNYSFEKHLDFNEKLNTHIIDSSFDESYGLISEYTNTSLKNKFVSLSLGYLNEDNAILGSSFTGAFGNLDNSKTFFTDSSVAYKVNRNNEILLKMAYANSQTNFEDPGLINEFSSIDSSYYSFGYGKKSLFFNNDKSTFSLTRPLKVDNGNIEIAVPKYATSDNGIIRENSNINLTPDNDQLNLEFNYNINKYNNNFNIGLLSIINNNHSNHSSIENLFKLTYSYSF